MRPLEQRLRQGLSDLSLTLNDHQIQQLLDYVDLIQKWTKVYNLTAVRDPADMVTHHLLDSLAVINPLRAQLTAPHNADAMPGDSDAIDVVGGVKVARDHTNKVRLLDVGSGAGLPGVVMAICCPGVAVDCVDAVAKKAAFIQQVAVSLRLPNLRGLHARVENLTDKYRVVSSRAFASLADFTTWSAGALADQGVWLGMKGKHPADEIAALPQAIKVFHVERLAVPGLDAERCIVWMRRG